MFAPSARPRPRAADRDARYKQFLAVHDKLPLRVNRGIRLAEYAARTDDYITAVIWTVSATEALLNTDRPKLRRQFVQRSAALGGELGVNGVTADVANAIYTARSESVHGAVPNIQDREQAVLELAAMQRLVRAALRRAVEVETFRDAFRDDSSVRARLPVSLT